MAGRTITYNNTGTIVGALCTIVGAGALVAMLAFGTFIWIVVIPGLTLLVAGLVIGSIRQK